MTPVSGRNIRELKQTTTTITRTGTIAVHVRYKSLYISLNVK